MFFTEEDYRKIEKWLVSKGVMDTQFSSAAPLDGNETVAIVQNGKNVNTTIDALVEKLFLLGVDDFLNVTDKYEQPAIPLIQAISLIPFRHRRIGQVITFLNEDNKWVIYQFQGSALTQWNNPTQWVNVIGSAITGELVPDEEDLTGIKEGDKTVLKFKNKAYNTANFSGLGRVYLRKNIVEIDDPIYGKVTKNILFQDMIAQANTIYEIRYDFDLNGEEITIPEGCVLDFQGGSIANGVIQGFNTGISTFNNENIFDNVVNKGTWSVKNILSKWWSDKGNGLAESIANMAKGNSCYIEFEYNEEYRYDFIGDDSGLFSIEVPSVYLFEKCGNVEVNLNGSTHIMNPNSSKWYRMFSFLDCENSYIGNGVLIGDRLNHTYNGETDEFGYGIRVIGKRCKIENMNISQFTGDAINVGGLYYVSGNRWIGELYGCQIIGCELHHCRRQGISFGFTRIDSICDIINNNIHDIGTNDGIEGASPMSGIDIEPSTNQVRPETIAGIFIIEDNVIKNCTNNSIISSWGNAVVEQIKINGLETDSILNISSAKLLHIDNLKYDGVVGGSNNSNITAKNELIISNSKFNLLGGKPFYIQKGLVKNCEFVGNKDATEVYSSVLSYNSTNTVVFENCKFQDVLGKKLEGTGRYSDGISRGIEILSPYFKFYNCVFNNCSGRFLYERNIEFIDCVIKGGSYFNLWNTKLEGCYIENIDSNNRIGDLVFTKCSILEDFNRTPYYSILTNNKLVLYNSSLKVSTIPDNDTRFNDSTTKCVAYNSELSYDVRHMAAMKNIVAVNSVVQARSDIPTITLVSSSYNRIGYDVNNPIGTERPTIGIYAGYQYYDKTINKPIWYNGTNWIDATGATV